MSLNLNPLANPKGVKLLCELCQKPAFIQCTKCRVTYYCDIEHQQADWVGIHEKICQLLIPLRTIRVSFLSSEEQRQKQEKELSEKRKRMVELTRTTGQKLLFEGKHEQAVPAAMQSLRFSIDVHGLDSIQLVPSYLILAEASIGLHKLTQAEEYLAQAQWTVLKTPDCSAAIKSKLYRNWGLLCAAQGNFEDSLRHIADDMPESSAAIKSKLYRNWRLLCAAQGNFEDSLRHIADDIYHASEEFGTDDIGTSGGYFHMANVFFRQNRMDIADSLYARVTDIWHAHLLRLVLARTQRPKTPAGIGAVAVELKREELECLDEAQEAEAKQVLHSIHDIREQSANEDNLVIAKVKHALAMLYFLLKDISKAQELVDMAKTLIEASTHSQSPLADYISEFSKSLARIPVRNGKEAANLGY